MGRATVLGVVTLFAGIMGTGTATAQAACSAHDARKPTAQERIAQRDIQEVIDQEIEELGAKDLAALSRQMPLDFTVSAARWDDSKPRTNHRRNAPGSRERLEYRCRSDVHAN
jgi:hypothetical protein